MRRSDRHIVYVLSAATDAALIVGCFMLSSRLRLGTYTGLENPVYSGWARYGVLVVVAYAVFLVCLYAAARVYGNTYYGRIGKVAASVIAVNTIGLALFGSMLYLGRLTDISRMTLAMFYVSSTLVVLVKQWVITLVLRHHRRRPDKRAQVLIVGSGSLAQKYAEVMADDPTRYENIVGHIASTGAEAADASHGENEADAPLGACLGTIPELDSVLARTNVDQLVVALEAEEYPYVKKVMAVADKYGVAVRLVPFYNDLLPRNPAIESVQDLQLIDMRSTALDNLFAAALKRIFDIVVSALILVLISPILLVTAIGVKLSSPGPILFKQERIGKNRKPFYMLKFRSMRVNAESTTAWSTDTDPRKTKFGSFIRKYSIDELPQFVNVLKGDMSIVGPRPEIPHYVHEFQEEVPLYMLRHQVRPGITGWAQVNGLRGDTSIEERVKYDLYYIENWSPWFDIKIFFRTIFGGFMNNEQLVK